MKVIANSNLAHGAYLLAKNEEVDMPDAIAHELERAGHVRIEGEKQSAEPENKMAQTPINKSKPGNKKQPD